MLERVDAASAPLLDEKSEPALGFETPRLECDDGVEAFAHPRRTRFRRRALAIGALVVLAVFGARIVHALVAPGADEPPSSPRPSRQAELADDLASEPARPLATPIAELVSAAPSPVARPVPSSSRAAALSLLASTSSAPASASAAVVPKIAIAPASAERACPDGQQCKFMVVHTVKDQETRALYHIKQIALLAQAANRTLVLPRASGGRYGLCRAHAFESYHSLAHFEGVMGIRAVAWRDFAALSQRAADDDEPLSGTMLHVREQKSHRRDKAGGRPRCMEDAPVRFGSEVSFAREASDDFSSALTTLVEGKVGAADAIFVDWHVGASVFREPENEQDAFPYSPALTDVADRIAASMRPYATVHWRLEAVGINEPDFIGCAESALDKLAALPNLTTLWVATDYPLEGFNHPHSTTFAHLLEHGGPVQRRYRELASAGIATLLGGFKDPPPHLPDFVDLRRRDRPLLDVTLRTEHLEHPTAIFPDEDHAMPIEDYDSGLGGVIDRLVAERADYYLVGEPTTCSHRSSFVRSIIEQRRKNALRAAGGERVDEQDVVDYFYPSAGKSSSVHAYY